MSPKTIIFIGLFVGSTLGSIIAGLFGADILSFTSALFSFAGGAVGIYFGYKFSQQF